MTRFALFDRFRPAGLDPPPPASPPGERRPRRGLLGEL